ncbi:MAG: phosphate/phosphite/phosphonate ABC transporter substrate-binding protein [Deltaproteobacteria bacterium]|nr:phosphate/phosphite/phosphonate ABC transporter substrate-binding protein [Deltaproteobacteria bacterium]
MRSPLVGALCGLVALSVATSCSSAPPPPVRRAPVLTLGAVSLGDSASRQAQLSPLVRHLERRLGGPVEATVASSYRELSRALAERRWDLVLTGPVVYSRAHEMGYQAVAVNSRGGAQTHRGIVVARADRGFTSIADLKGRKLAFVDPHSASGFEYPFAFLWAQGLRPSDYQREFAGGHEKVLQAVLAGTVDAGAAYAGAITDLLPPERAKELTVLGLTDPVPGEVFAVRADLANLPLLRDTLLELDREKDPEAARILEALTAHRLVAPADGLFDGARAIDLLVTEGAGL